MTGAFPVSVIFRRTTAVVEEGVVGEDEDRMYWNIRRRDGEMD